MGEISQVETKGRDMDLVPEKEMENHSGQTVEVAGNQQSGENRRGMGMVYAICIYLCKIPTVITETLIV